LISSAYVLYLYQELFDIEDRIQGRPSSEILQARQVEAKPILEKIKQYLF